MQYVRSISGSVSKTWNSINPATLSGAIDVIVVEQEDGSLACSPFHVRFGKFSLLRPYEKKVEFKVNNVKQDYAMKLGEGGEAFFVFETTDDIPESLQTSPLVSPAASPTLRGEESSASNEPDFLDLETNTKLKSAATSRPGLGILNTGLNAGSSTSLDLTPLSGSPEKTRPVSRDWSENQTGRPNTDELLPSAARFRTGLEGESEQERQTRSLTPSVVPHESPSGAYTERSTSPPPVPTKEAIERAMALSKQLSMSNIPSQVTETGDLMLDMTGYKSSDDDALRAEVIARKILSEELEGNYDIGALIGADERGNLWIYSSEEAKEAATQRAALAGLAPSPVLTSDAASDPGYHSDGGESDKADVPSHIRAGSDLGAVGLGLGIATPPQTPPDSAVGHGDPNRNYAKTLRLTSDQLKSLGLKAGLNPMTFTVNRATCSANMYLWRYDVPVVISDIDGTITKSDALGHVLNMIGRDWTHVGVAKLYTEIVANGYNIMYLTSRSVGQADTTRAYLNGIVQESYRLPKGPTILSPDRTIAALRREVYLRKPEVFKMACLRDIKNLFGPNSTPFYAGFGNRLTDALSYRSVSIPSTRIFTINSYAQISLDLLSLNKMKLSYVNMREVVDHFFPPASTLVKGGGEEFTDFTYWRDNPLELEEFSASDSDESDGGGGKGQDDEGQSEGDEEVDVDDVDEEGDMGDSYISRASMESSFISEEHSVVDDEGDEEGYEEGEEGDEEESAMEDELRAQDEENEADDEAAETPMALQEPANNPLEGVQEDVDAEIVSGVKGVTLDPVDTQPAKKKKTPVPSRETSQNEPSV